MQVVQLRTAEPFVRVISSMRRMKKESVWVSEGGKERVMEGGRERVREGGRKEGREGGREGESE